MLAVVGLIFNFVPGIFDKGTFNVEVEACLPDARIEAGIVNKVTGERTAVDTSKMAAMVRNHLKLINKGTSFVEKSLLDINFFGATEDFEILEIIVVVILGSPPNNLLFDRSKKQPTLGDLLHLALPLLNPSDHIDIVFYTNQPASASVSLLYKGQTISEQYSRICNVSEPSFGGAFLCASFLRNSRKLKAKNFLWTCRVKLTSHFQFQKTLIQDNMSFSSA
jgi:hypothetical protein